MFGGQAKNPNTSEAGFRAETSATDDWMLPLT